jgi:pimeloyl-ACP methyl ester carboxylesterase
MAEGALRVREHGAAGPVVIALHGGPGAPGYMAPVGRRLADRFRVLEPLQRRSGGEPLTVARHVADLHEVVSRLGGERPALVGHSWGAMLALAYAASHPQEEAALVLVGCGTFDRAARDRLRAIRERRADPALRRRLRDLPREVPDPDERLRVLGNLILPLYSHEPVAEALEVEACDSRGHRESWDDMMRLQDEGVYPAAFASIRAPVLMLHGEVDPHPGPWIRESLRPHLPQLEYHELARCGHFPWLERGAADEFFSVLRRWLGRRLPAGEGGRGAGRSGDREERSPGEVDGWPRGSSSPKSR